MHGTHQQVEEITLLAMENFAQWERMVSLLPGSQHSHRTHECYGLLRGYRDSITVMIPEGSPMELLTLRKESVDSINMAIEILQEALA